MVELEAKRNKQRIQPKVKVRYGKSSIMLKDRIGKLVEVDKTKNITSGTILIMISKCIIKMADI